MNEENWVETSNIRRKVKKKTKKRTEEQEKLTHYEMQEREKEE